MTDLFPTCNTAFSERDSNNNSVRAIDHLRPELFPEAGTGDRIYLPHITRVPCASVAPESTRDKSAIDLDL